MFMTYDSLLAVVMQDTNTSTKANPNLNSECVIILI